MANTTLFAPQVRAVQPAFTGTSFKIYFLVPYGVSINSVDYKIIDPTQSSTSGALIENNIAVSNSQTLEERHIELIIGASLALNKIYQIQLRLVQGTGSGATKSPWSQITLIKKVEECTLSISGNNIFAPFDNAELNGEILYSGKDNGPLLKNCTFIENDTNITLSGRVSGSQFYIPISQFFLTQTTISGRVIVETIDGYFKEEEKTFSLGVVGNSATALTILLNETAGGADISNIPTTANYLIRKDNESPFWTVIGRPQGQSSWLDCLAEGGKFYTYAALTSLSSYANPIAKGQLKNLDGEVCESNFEDMFLSDDEVMLAIRFNPSLSGLKYVTQEAVTNTLGGKYPTIRKNGDTKYKQFSISGILYLDYYTNENLGCSNATILANQTPKIQYTQDVWYHDNSNLYLINNNLATELSGYSQKSIEKILRQKAEEFLTNGKPKVFRSYDEGPMIVYLNNISFTPNKQLGHHIYDFSAQANEICEFSTENMNKYGLNEATFSQFFLDSTKK